MSLAKRPLPVREYRLSVSGVDASITHKRVRNLTISVHRGGTVRVTAPARAARDDVARAIAGKIEWIRKTQARLGQLPAPRELEYVSGEMHRFRGDDLELRVIHDGGRPRVNQGVGRILELHVRADADARMRRAVMQRWYREQLAALLPDIIARWGVRMRVMPVEWRIRRMRTRWGTCNTRARRIWLNLELATLSPESLEYIVVHELAHLLEPSHNLRFRSFMDQFLPDWRRRRSILNTEGAARSLREG